jgi:hypothetical protein
MLKQKSPVLFRGRAFDQQEFYLLSAFEAGVEPHAPQRGPGFQSAGILLGNAKALL